MNTFCSFFNFVGISGVLNVALILLKCTSVYLCFKIGYILTIFLQSRVSPCKSSPSPTSPNTSFDSSDNPLRLPPSSSSSYFSSSPLTTSAGSYLPPQSSPSSQSHGGYPFHSHRGGETSNSNIPHCNNPSNIPRGAHGTCNNSTAMWNSVPTHSTPLNKPSGTVGARSTPPNNLAMSVLKNRKKSGGGQPFDPDSAPARLNFTYRREMEKQQHEKQLIDNLRNV